MAWKKTLNCGLKDYSMGKKKVGNKDKAEMGLLENEAKA